MKNIMKMRLELINNQIEKYKKKAIKNIEKEEMIPATSCFLILRDLKEQQLLLKDLLKKEKEYYLEYDLHIPRID